MALSGVGILPTGSVLTELTNVTRRAFVPKLIVQLYKSTPLMMALIENAQIATGGIDEVTVPVQGAQMVNMEWSGYSGTFSQPALQTGINQDAAYDLKLAIVPIPFLGMEGLVQSEHAIVNLAEARMNDAAAVMRDGFAGSLFASAGTNTTQMLGALSDCIDDGQITASYGNINRTTSSYWASYSKAMGSVAPTRASVLENISAVTGGASGTGGWAHGLGGASEMPTMGICGFATWTKLAEDFQGQERYQSSGGESVNLSGGTGFTALMVAGVPIYPDPYCPEGTLYLLNTNYLNLYMHQAANFAFTGFESTLPNFQIGYVGALLNILELVNVKGRAHGKITGYTYASF